MKTPNVVMRKTKSVSPQTSEGKEDVGLETPTALDEANCKGFEAPLCVLTGGPMREIQVNGKRYKFEMHPLLRADDTKAQRRTAKASAYEFLHAASRWAQQGQRLDESGLCVWEHEPEPILKHLGGRHYKITGYIEARKGE